MKRPTVANRVFVGYPWKPYRVMWEALATDLHRRYPLHLLAIGREDGQPANQLLVKIMKAIDVSTLAIFDASLGNANVSLEYGYARSLLGEDYVYLFIDEDWTPPTGPGTPIISDLAGAVANKYRTVDARLRTAVKAICDRHPYTKRFNIFCRQRGYRGGTQKFLLRIIRQFDTKQSVLRRELIDETAHEARKPASYVERYLKELNDGGLVTITRGNHFSSRVFIGG
jgi:hypothetical protein